MRWLLSKVARRNLLRVEIDDILIPKMKAWEREINRKVEDKLKAIEDNVDKLLIAAAHSKPAKRKWR